MKKDAFIKLLEKYAKNETTAAEEKQVDDYFNNITSKTNLSNINVEQVQNKVYNKIQKKIYKRSAKKYSKTVYLKWSFAASILLIVGYSIFSTTNFTTKQITAYTAYGQKKEVLLPDGTVVTLNSGSSIEYPEKFSNKQRTVILKGEAFFDVHRNPLKPFVIETGALKTRVLGTSFNVNAFTESDSVKVSVAEGKVMVFDQKNVREILLPNEQLAYNKINQGYKKFKSDSFKDYAWSNNVIYFGNITLGEAVKILERWYNVSIKISEKDLSKEIIKGKYKEQTLRQVLESLSFLLNLELQQISDTKYVITKNKQPM